MPSPVSRRSPRFRARWWLPSAAMLCALIAVEGVMQIAAYAIWAKQRHPVAPASGQTVLCIGDSWTHGMGSQDPATGSYPARVRTHLDRAGLTGWNVVNGGQSGQNSRDVLERLPSQLAEFRPSLVCVLVGQNDFWSQPKRMAADEQATFDHSAYRFRWRLPRLWNWALGNARGVSEAPAPARDPALWAPHPPAATPDPYANEPSTWPWTPEIGRRKDAGFAKSLARDYVGAFREFESLLADTPDDPQVHQALADLHRTLGRGAEATRELEWLRQAWRTRSGYWVGNSLVVALQENGRWLECIEVATAFLERFPLAAQAWSAKAFAEWQAGQIDAAVASIDRAIGLACNRWYHFNRYKILWLGRHDAEAAIRAQFRLYELDNDAEFLAQNLRTFADQEHADLLRRVARDHVGEAAVRARLIEIVDEVLAASDLAHVAATLAAHLERILVAVRNAGAEPVVLCYPWRNAARAVLEATAAEQGAPFVDVETLFADRVRPRPMQEVRAPDGHCNDDGYTILAAIVAEHLLPLVRARTR